MLQEEHLHEEGGAQVNLQNSDYKESILLPRHWNKDDVLFVGINVYQMVEGRIRRSKGIAYNAKTFMQISMLWKASHQVLICS